MLYQSSSFTKREYSFHTASDTLLSFQKESLQFAVVENVHKALKTDRVPLLFQISLGAVTVKEAHAEKSRYIYASTYTRAAFIIFASAVLLRNYFKLFHSTLASRIGECQHFSRTNKHVNYATSGSKKNWYSRCIVSGLIRGVRASRS